MREGGPIVCISDLAEMQKPPQERSSLRFPAFLLNQTELLLHDKVPLSPMELPGSFSLIIAVKNP